MAGDRGLRPEEAMVYLNVLDRFETPAYERAWRFFRELAGTCPDYQSFRERCPLWSEDLTQTDEVASVIRAVGPTMVVTPLLDGPQLSSRERLRGTLRRSAADPGSTPRR